MKRTLILLLAFVAVPALTAQVVDPTLLDCSRAELSLAGPDRVYVSSIYYAGERLSVVLDYDGQNAATIYGPYFDADKVLLDDYELGYATLDRHRADTILVRGVVLAEGIAYSGTLRWDGGAGLEVADLWRSASPVTQEEKIASLNERIDKLNDALAQAQKEARAPVVTATPAAAAAPAAIPLPSRTVLSGFGRGTALTGKWQTSSRSAKQSDANEKFAKLSIPVSQRSSQTLFGFAGRADDSRWVGYGLHFFASGEETAAGYGYGKSFLIWLTRDPAYYQSDRTYVQIYRSLDDIRMIQVASASIPETISSTLRTEVLYDRSERMISVFVNGRKRLDYLVESPLSSGNKVALRALGGTVEFTDLFVRE